MELKKQVEELKELYDAQADHAMRYLALAEQIKLKQNEIQSTMDEQGLDSFNCALGKLELENKLSFSVPKERKKEMIEYFESDPNLAPMVKIVKDVHYQTRTKVFRDMYQDENAVPDFVKVETFTELKPKFNDFKEQKQYLDKIKKKQQKSADQSDDAE